MKPLRLISTCMLFTFLAALPAMAGPRTFVSGLGNDANPGTREQPKRTFASALTVTDSGGEIIVLDSAGYASGPLTINKAVSIIAPPGLYAGLRIGVNSGIAVTINAAAGDSVVLRGLSLSSSPGLGPTGGINILSAGTVLVENCVLSGFGQSGISTESLFTSLLITIKDTLLRKNHGSGISLGRSGTPISAMIERCRMEENSATGVTIKDATKAIVRDSVSMRNFQSGLAASGSGALMNVENCVASQNGSIGIVASGNSIVRVSNSTATDNGSGGLANAGGTFFYSRGNNTVHGNGDGTFDTSGPITALSGK